LIFVLLTVASAALAGSAVNVTGAGDSRLYERFQADLEDYFSDQFGRDIGTVARGSSLKKQSAYVDGYSTEGGEVSKYTDASGRAVRYRLELYGEGGRWQSDYYLLNGALCIYELSVQYSSHIFWAQGSEDLHYDLTKYVLAGRNWYCLDDVGRLAYPISKPGVFSVAELEEMLAGGGSWDGDSHDGTSFPAFPYTGQSATLIERMATRTGPNTKYTEPGTFSIDTDITVFYQTEGNGVMWAMVEFQNNRQWYRLYTGMKRIDADWVPRDDEAYETRRLSRDATPVYGPGEHYASSKVKISSGERVKVFFEEGGYVMIDYEGGKQVLRGWVPVSAIE